MPSTQMRSQIVWVLWLKNISSNQWRGNKFAKIIIKGLYIRWGQDYKKLLFYTLHKSQSNIPEIGMVKYSYYFLACRGTGKEQNPESRATSSFQSFCRLGTTQSLSTREIHWCETYRSPSRVRLRVVGGEKEDILYSDRPTI